MYKVQKDVPIPKVARPHAKNRRLYPFESLEVGGMFFVPDKKRNTLMSHASATGTALERKFATRLCYMRQDENEVWQPCEADDDNAVLGIGVWRTA